jgi:2-amino-4-hydroxy-6-hydroxymethyldihydropteridine diphosphokinase
LTGTICYIGIGSNLGNPLQNCKNAVGRISRIYGVKLIKVSSFYLTEPVETNAHKYSIENHANFDGDGNKKNNTKVLESMHKEWFINTVAEIETNLSANDLLMKLQDIETKMGRKRKIKGEPRVIDLDLLFYGQDIINEYNLIVPHPEIHKRRFVLEPLSEIASFYIHPAFGVSIRGLKDRLKDQSIVKLHKSSDS